MAAPTADSFRFDAFKPEWYERHRGNRIRPRFNIPSDSSQDYAASLEPQHILHELMLHNKAEISPGRVEEADNLSVNAAYLT